MQERLKINLTFLTKMQQYKTIWNNIKVDQNILYINTSKGIVKLDLNQINEKELTNPNFISNIENISIDKFAEFLTIASKVDEVLPKNSKEELEKNLKIKNFKILEKQLEDGTIVEYPYYIDENNRMHILKNYANTNILREYHQLVLNKGGNVTEKELFELLERKMKNINLYEDYKVAENNMRENTLFEINQVNKTNPSDRVLLNEQEDIYVTKNDKNIYTFNVDDQGINMNKHTNEDQNNNTDFKLANEEEQIKQEEKIEIEEPKQENHINLISEEEYYVLIQYYLPTEKPEIFLFEAFIEDCILMQEYLSDDLKQLINRNNKHMEQLEMSKNITNSQQQALNRYKETMEKIEHKQDLKYNKEEILVRVKKLEESRKTGFTNFYIIICLINIMITTLTIIFFIKR